MSYPTRAKRRALRLCAAERIQIAVWDQMIDELNNNNRRLRRMVECMTASSRQRDRAAMRVDGGGFSGRTPLAAQGG